MNVRILTQPAATGRLGDLLKEQLGAAAATRWTEFRAAVAFVKRSGVRHIAGELAGFTSRSRVRMSVGVDRGGSSQEGLQILLDAVVARGGRVWVFRNADLRVEPTFHPKVYLFKEHGRALAVVGSGNLTSGGLWTNYEADVVFDLNLADAGDAALLREIEAVLDIWCDETQGLARQLTPEYLARLIASGHAPTEVRARPDEPAQEDGEVPGVAEAPPEPAGGIFGYQRVPGAPATPRPTRRRGQPRTPAPTPKAIPAATVRGAVIWQKPDLSRTDAQRTPAGTNPKGGVSLTQAGYRGTDGRPINPTTYFRRTLFGRFGWKTVKWAGDKREEAEIPFEVRLLGQTHGVHSLVVSHKESREAGQRNYTSFLHWGDLTQVVRGLPLVGRTLTIYEPAGLGGPYILEVA
jgi:hypothetical protein